VTWSATFERDPAHPTTPDADAAASEELHRALSGLAAAVAETTASAEDVPAADAPRTSRRPWVEARDVRPARARTATP
jgi:hypothetical protein